MKLRFPLYAKILLLLALNLALLGGVVLYFAQGQLRFSLDALLTGRAGERVQSATEVIVQELAGGTREEWEETLLRFSIAYDLEFHLYRNDGTPAVGSGVTLPAEVLRRIRENPGGQQLPRPPGWVPPEGGPVGEMSADSPRFRDGKRPEGKRFEGPRVDPERKGPPDLAGRPQPGQLPFGKMGRPAGFRSPFPKFLVRTDNPRRFWVLVRLPMLDRERQRFSPMTLVIESPTLSGNGLLLDYKPWLYAAVTGVALSFLLWFPLVRGITRSVARMRQATAQIAEGRLDARVELDRNDELGSLGEAINGMAARLEGFVGGQKRFLGDTAHELCAPIARIQMALGILEARADGAQRDYVNDLREEVQHMSALVNELLSFSKASLRQRQLTLEPVDLNEMAKKVIAREADDGGSVTVDIPAGLKVMAEPELLSRSVANLVRNALRYAADGGPIEIRARPVEQRVELTVADHGKGVPEEALEKIFDPFYRLDASRNRETGGVGLGLAIVKTCVEACQAKVSARNRQPHGLEVTISLQSA
jgi:two-component system sensor histidine kinase CpxA